MEFEKVIKDRVSVRSYKDETVSDELIEKILEAGRIAPTAKNRQPQIIYVAKTKESLDLVDRVSPCRYNAQVCLIVCADKTKAFSKENYTSIEMDASIVTTHMMLEATNLGVDSTWIKIIDEQKIKEELNLDESIEPICMLNLGYRTDDYKESPLHKEKKELNEMVRYI